METTTTASQRLLELFIAQRDCGNELVELFIDVATKAVAMENEEVDSICEEAIHWLKLGFQEKCGIAINKLIEFPELEESVLNLTMACCEFRDEDPDFKQTVETASERDKFIANEVCKVVAEDNEDAFDNEAQRTQHIRLMGNVSYQLEFLKMLRESVNGDINDDEKLKITTIIANAEKAYDARSVS